MKLTHMKKPSPLKQKTAICELLWRRIKRGCLSSLCHAETSWKPGHTPDHKWAIHVLKTYITAYCKHTTARPAANGSLCFHPEKSSLKGQFSPKSKQHLFTLTCSDILSPRLFWCELPNWWGIGCRDVCLLLTIMELDGTGLLELEEPKK